MLKRWRGVLVHPRATRTGLTDPVTNLDQLTGIGELRICTAYEHNGRSTTEFSPRPAELDRATPVYETFDGWDEDISQARGLGELPSAARQYVEAIQELLGVPVRYVSVGSHRDALIETATTSAQKGN